MGTNFSLSFCRDQELKFSQNQRKLGLKKQYFSKTVSGVSGAKKGLEMVGLRSEKSQKMA